MESFHDLFLCFLTLKRTSPTEDTVSRTEETFESKKSSNSVCAHVKRDIAHKINSNEICHLSLRFRVVPEDICRQGTYRGMKSSPMG